MRRVGLLISLLGVFAAMGYWCYQRIPWIDVAARIHSQSGSVECGHISEPDARAAQGAIDCAMSARQSGHPFVVIFSVHGTDERVSNALVGDSRGNAIELFYATGMVNNANTVMKHRCDVPVQLRVDPPDIYHIPRLHCAPWPPTHFVKDRLLW